MLASLRSRSVPLPDPQPSEQQQRRRKVSKLSRPQSTQQPHRQQHSWSFSSDFDCPADSHSLSVLVSPFPVPCLPQLAVWRTRSLRSHSSSHSLRKQRHRWGTDCCAIRNGAASEEEQEREEERDASSSWSWSWIGLLTRFAFLLSLVLLLLLSLSLSFRTDPTAFRPAA